MRLLILSLLCLFSAALHAQPGLEDGPEAPVREAAQAMRSRQYIKAEFIYRGMLDADPTSNTTRQLLSHALILQGRYGEADSINRSIIVKDSNVAGSYWYLALSAERQNQYDRAVYLFDRYLAKTQGQATQNQSAWLHMGSNLRRKMHDKGINEQEWGLMQHYYKQYLSGNPPDPYVDSLYAFLDEVRRRRPSPGALLRWDESGSE
jgi:tetratricopeptide (TPR) repeat protein